MQTNLLTKNWHSFIKLCRRLKTEKQFVELFNLFLTDAEREDIATRYAIIEALLLGKETQRSIAKQLKISIAKITRGSNAMRIANSKIKNLIKGRGR